MKLFNSIIPFAGRRSQPPAIAGAETEPTVRPYYTVVPLADDSGWTLTVSLPGVAKPGLSITDEADVLTIRGERTWKRPDDWTTLHRESSESAYSLALRHDGEIDGEKIKADFADGILTATLPKAEALKPRKIAIS